MQRLLLSLVVLAAALYVSARPVGPAPALGSFLEPANGVWALARTANPPARAEARIPGLGAPVEVLVDDRGVPHVFARSEADAWRAQGYLLARDRLFQMELSTRAASGTLSELVGGRALEVDRIARRRGLAWGPERLDQLRVRGHRKGRKASHWRRGSRTPAETAGPGPGDIPERARRPPPFSRRHGVRPGRRSAPRPARSSAGCTPPSEPAGWRCGRAPRRRWRARGTRPARERDRPAAPRHRAPRRGPREKPEDVAWRAAIRFTRPRAGVKPPFRCYLGITHRADTPRAPVPPPESEPCPDSCW